MYEEEVISSKGWRNIAKNNLVFIGTYACAWYITNFIVIKNAALVVWQHVLKKYIKYTKFIFKIKWCEFNAKIISGIKS